MQYFLTYCIITVTIYVGIVSGQYKLKTTTFKDVQIKNIELARCEGTENDPLTVHNVSAEVINKNVFIGGNFILGINVNSPVRAQVEVKRHVSFIWIEVPCAENVGSCSYKDLCKYGVPKEKNCPEEFRESNVPCRCPVKQGNYTLSPKTNFFVVKRTKKSIISGKYKGNINIWNGDDTRLACYNFNFIIV